jgi:hypothetical protein
MVSAAEGFLICGAVALLGLGCNSAERPQVQLSRAALGNTAPPTSCPVPARRQFVVELPASVLTPQVALSATTAIKVGDKAQVKRESPGGPTIANAGRDKVDIGNNTLVGPIVSVGPVLLERGARVDGDVVTSDKVHREPDVTVKGGVREKVNLTPFTRFTWTIDFGQPCLGDVTVEARENRALVPNTYGALRVKDGGRVVLASGTYQFAAVKIERGGELVVEDREGPVLVWIATELALHGRMVAKGSATPALMLGVHGSSVDLDTSFLGTLVAPNANLKLPAGGSGHRGAFFARRIELEKKAVVTLVPFERSLPPPSGGARPTAGGTFPPNGDEPPPPLRPENIPAPVAPPPLTATPDAVRAFVRWVSASQVSQVTTAQTVLRQHLGDEPLGVLLVDEAAAAQRTNDLSLALVALAVLGEIRSRAGEAYFMALLDRPAPASGTVLDHDVTPREAHALEMLQAKAADGLAYLRTQRANQELVRHIAEHGSTLVRTEAIRALLENNGPGFRSFVEPSVRAEDRVALDWIEPFTAWDSRPFDVRLAEFLGKHPEAVLPQPVATAMPGCLEGRCDNEGGAP